MGHSEIPSKITDFWNVGYIGWKTKRLIKTSWKNYMDINDWFSLKCYGSLKNQIRRIFSLTCLNWNDSKQIYPWQNCNMHSKISNHICLKHFWYSNHLFKFILKSSRLENVGKCLTIPCLLNWSIFFCLG